jgi:hypothetical protein
LSAGNKGIDAFHDLVTDGKNLHRDAFCRRKGFCASGL